MGIRKIMQANCTNSPLKSSTAWSIRAISSLRSKENASLFSPAADPTALPAWGISHKIKFTKRTLLYIFAKEAGGSHRIVYFIITDCVQFVKRQMTTQKMYDITTLCIISYNLAIKRENHVKRSLFMLFRQFSQVAGRCKKVKIHAVSRPPKGGGFIRRPVPAKRSEAARQKTEKEPPAALPLRFSASHARRIFINSSPVIVSFS